jgi:hypothetical protein
VEKKGQVWGHPSTALKSFASKLQRNILFSKNPKEKPKNPKMKNGIEQKFLVERGVTSVKRDSCKRLNRAIQEQDKTCP